MAQWDKWDKVMKNMKKVLAFSKEGHYNDSCVVKQIQRMRF